MYAVSHPRVIDGMRFGGKGKSLPPLYLIAVLALEDDVGNPRDY